MECSNVVVLVRPLTSQVKKSKSNHSSLCPESLSAVTTLSGPIMVNQSKTNSQPRQIHPFFSKVASSGSSSAATSGPPSGTSHVEAPVSIDLTAPASPVASLSSFLSAESLSTLHAEFASIPDLVTGTTPILESILGLESENDTEDDDSDDSSSGDNISGNTTSTDNPSDSSLSGDSGNIFVRFLKTVLANLKAEIETK